MKRLVRAGGEGGGNGKNKPKPQNPTKSGTFYFQWTGSFPFLLFPDTGDNLPLVQTYIHEPATLSECLFL